MDAFAKRYVSDQFMQYGMPAPEGEQLQLMAARMLGDQEQINRIRGTIVEQKLMVHFKTCLLYTSPSPRDRTRSRMPSSA